MALAENYLGFKAQTGLWCGCCCSSMQVRVQWSWIACVDHYSVIAVRADAVCMCLGEEWGW